MQQLSLQEEDRKGMGNQNRVEGRREEWHFPQNPVLYNLGVWNNSDFHAAKTQTQLPFCIFSPGLTDSTHHW